MHPQNGLFFGSCLANFLERRKAEVQFRGMILLRAWVNTPSRDCLESSWTGRMVRFWQRIAPKKRPFCTVLQAQGSTKRTLFGVSRQSLRASMNKASRRTHHPAIAGEEPVLRISSKSPGTRATEDSWG